MSPSPSSSPRGTAPSPTRPLGTAAGFWRRLAIVVYDGMLLAAVLFLSATPLVLLNHGDAPDLDSPLAAFAIRGYYLAVAFGYYGWFWTRGQTLGMRAWKTVIADAAGDRIGWRQAAMRFVTAVVSWGCLGLGFLWALGDRDRRTWHDLASGTRLVVIDPKRARAGA